MLEKLLDGAAYMAHGYCLMWEPWLVSLHAASDLLITAAYFAIPIAIWIFVANRPDLEMKGLARLFAAFILWCGLTHLFNIFTLWWPIYEIQGGVKAITAAVSLTTAILIFPLIPRALAIPSPRALQAANDELEREVAAHRHTLAELERARAELEDRVEARTRELREATARFRSLFVHAPVAMLMVDSRGALQQINEAAEALFGYSEDQLIGQEIDMLLPASRRAAHKELRDSYFAAPSARPMGVGRDLHALRMSGEEFPVEIGLNPIEANDGRPFVIASIVDISARREAEQRMQFIMRELSHRSKNLLAVVQGMVRQTAAFAPDLKTFESDFSDRLQGLARSHNLLVARDWQGAPLGELVETQLEFIVGSAGQAIAVDGPELIVTPSAAQNLGLAFHELATNALKHGALSAPEGRIKVSWTVASAENGHRLELTWTEMNGPKVTAPQHPGFGSVVLQTIVPQALGGSSRLSFDIDGAVWKLDAPLDLISTESEATTAMWLPN